MTRLFQVITDTGAVILVPFEGVVKAATADMLKVKYEGYPMRWAPRDLHLRLL